MARTAKLNLQKWTSLVVIGIGVALMIMMILTEDEPGLLPLLLIAFGATWYFITRRRIRAVRS